MILNIPSATAGHTITSDYLSYPIKDVNKTFLDVVNENTDLTTDERDQLIEFLTMPIHGDNSDKYLVSEPNPDYVDEETTPDEDPELLVVPTIAEFATLIQGGLGAEFQLISDNTQRFRVVILPPLEDSIGERSLMYLFGKGRNKPTYTLWRWIGNKEFKAYLEAVPSDI